MSCRVLATRKRECDLKIVNIQFVIVVGTPRSIGARIVVVDSLPSSLSFGLVIKSRSSPRNSCVLALANCVPTTAPRCSIVSTGGRLMKASIGALPRSAGNTTRCGELPPDVAKRSTRVSKAPISRVAPTPRDCTMSTARAGGCCSWGGDGRRGSGGGWGRRVSTIAVSKWPLVVAILRSTTNLLLLNDYTTSISCCVGRQAIGRRLPPRRRLLRYHRRLLLHEGRLLRWRQSRRLAVAKILARAATCGNHADWTIGERTAEKRVVASSRAVNQTIARSKRVVRRG